MTISTMNPNPAIDIEPITVAPETSAAAPPQGLTNRTLDCSWQCIWGPLL